MNPTSIAALLERFEHELQTADGRTVKVCRDANGNFWAIDAAERVMSLSELASDLAPQARRLCERERTQAMREFVAAMKRGAGRIVRAFGWRARPAHA